MNIMALAYKQLEREGLLNRPNEGLNLIDRAVKIKKWLDNQARNKKVAERRYSNV